MSFFNNNNTTQATNVFGAGNTPSTNTTTGSTNAFAAKPAGGIFGGGGNASGGGNIFGGTGSSATTSAGGGLFGAGGTTPSPAPASTAGGNAATTGGSAFGSASNIPSTGNIFGGGANSSTTSANNTTQPSAASIFAGSAFSIPKPAEQTKPVTSDFFSQPSTTPATQPSTSNPPNGLFSLPPKPAATSSTPAANISVTNSGIPATGLFGGNLFSKPSTPSTTAPTTIPSTFSLGGNKDASSGSSGVAGLFAGPPTNKETEKKDSTPAAGFSLFGGTKPTDKKDTPTTASALGSKEGGQLKDATNTTPSTSSAPNPVVTVPPPSMLRGKTLEEIVNRWTAETEANVREFNKFAGEVAVWDRALIENGNNIAALYGHVLAAERNQNEINESLDHVEQQQKELGSILDSYEKVLSQDGSFRAMDTGPADNERDKNYMLATDLHTHLDDLSGSLKQMIDSVNELSVASKPSETNDEPLSQIAQILSSHLESLQWIDSAVRDIEGKTTEVEKRVRESGHNLSNTGAKSRAFGPNR